MTKEEEKTAEIKLLLQASELISDIPNDDGSMSEKEKTIRGRVKLELMSYISSRMIEIRKK